MKPLSRRTIERTLLYIRTLEDLLRSGCQRVSSAQLAAILGATDVQIRKEISNFGKVGKPRVGYDVAQLKKVLQDYLLKGKTVTAVLFGVGNLGRAIIRYPGFQRGKVKLTGAFDKDPRMIGRVVNGVRIYPAKDALKVIRRHRADLGIIAVPVPASQSVADTMVRAGIRGIVNFSPTRVQVPARVLVSDIDLTIEFLSLYCDTRFKDKVRK